MSSTIQADGPDLNDSGKGRKWNAMMVLFVTVSVLVSIMLVCGLASLIFPDLGIPFFFVAFPVAPQPVPIPG